MRATVAPGTVSCATAIAAATSREDSPVPGGRCALATAGSATLSVDSAFTTALSSAGNAKYAPVAAHITIGADAQKPGAVATNAGMRTAGAAASAATTRSASSPASSSRNIRTPPLTPITKA
jgi:hypothetical protein